MLGGLRFKRGNGNPGCQQQVVTLVKPAHQRPEFAAAQRQLLQFQHRNLAALFGLPAQCRVGQRDLFRRHVADQAVRTDEPELGRNFLGIGKPRRDLVDLRALRRERIGGAADRAGDLGIDIAHITEIGTERDAQSAHAIVQSDPIVARVVRQRGPVARVGTAHYREHQRQVFDAAGVRSQVRDGSERRQGKCGNAAERWLQSRNAAERRGDTYRPRTVGAHRQRPHPRGDRRRRATRRASRRHRGVPRVIGDAGQRVVGRALDAEFGRRRLAEQHRARLAQPRDDWRIDVPCLCRIDGARAAQCRPAFGEDQVLDRYRHAVEDVGWRALVPACLRCPRAGQRTVRIDEAKRVQHRIEFGHPRQHRLRRLDR